MPNFSKEIIDVNLHEQIIAIDSRDNRVYPVGKLDAHLQNIPHVAISVFIFHDDRLLLQKRADTKYHSGGLWANSVCSHPRWQESAEECADRRLREELGWSVSLREFGAIDYKAPVGDLFENEHVHCFAGVFDEKHNVDLFNREEVADVQWLSVPEIIRKIHIDPGSFTAWFKIYMAEHHQMIDEGKRHTQ